MQIHAIVQKVFACTASACRPGSRTTCPDLHPLLKRFEALLLWLLFKLFGNHVSDPICSDFPSRAALSEHQILEQVCEALYALRPILGGQVLVLQP
eukprot:3276433-Karenia_brevis.AAC.1